MASQGVVHFAMAPRDRDRLAVVLSSCLLRLPLIILPQVFDVCFGQALVRAMRLLPPLKAAPENAHLLRDRDCLCRVVPSFLFLLFSGLCCCCRCLLALRAGALGRSDGVLAELCLALSYVSQGGAGSALFRQGAVEDDCLGVLELAQERGQPLVELVRGHPTGALDVPAYVIYGESYRLVAYQCHWRHRGNGAAVESAYLRPEHRSRRPSCRGT